MRPSTWLKIGVAAGIPAVLIGLHFVLPRAARWFGGATTGLESHASTHFTAYATDAKEAERVGEAAEKYSSEFVARWGAARGFELPDPPVVIYEFENHEALSKYTKIKLGRWLDFNGGYFSEAERTLALVRGGDKALRHELTHMMVGLAWPGAEVTPWFSEGQAQWHEAGVAGAFPQSAAESAARILQSDGALSLEALLDAPEVAFASAGNEVPYTEAFALFAWLAVTRPDALERVVESERRPGRATAAQFGAAVGLPLETIEAEWKAWVLRTGK